MNDVETRLNQLKQRFKAWRRQKKIRSEAIPEELLVQARRLCKEMRPYRVALALGIEAAKLKISVSDSKGKGPTCPSGQFVDLDLSSLSLGHAMVAGESGNFRCEWERTDGAKLRIDASSLNIAELVGSFLRGPV